MKKISVYKAFDREKYQWYEFEDFPRTVFGQKLSV